MAIAFVLIITETGFMDEVLASMNRIPNVTEAHMVYGVYDIVVKVEAESMSEIKEIVTHRIRRLDKVRSSQTMIVLEE